MAPDQIAIIGPDGTVEAPHAAVWHAEPGDPYGVYLVGATRDRQAVQGSFTVDAASQPRVSVEPESAMAGVQRSILLAGWTPGQSVPLRLYGYIWSGSTH